MFNHTRLILGSIGIPLAAGFALAVGLVATAHHVDSMFKTSNTFWDCTDEGNSTPGDFFCQTDNSDFTVFMESSLTSTGKNTITSVLNAQFSPTDLNLIFESSPSYSGGSETDVIYQARGDLPSDGLAWCDDAVSSTKCDQHYVAFLSSSPIAALACHETGHAVGLTHGQQASPSLSNTDSSLGCMQTPTSTSSLGTHNTTQINATY